MSHMGVQVNLTGFSPSTRAGTSRCRLTACCRHGVRQPVLVVALLVYFLLSRIAFLRGSYDNDRTPRSLSQKSGIIAPFQLLFRSAVRERAGFFLKISVI